MQSSFQGNRIQDDISSSSDISRHQKYRGLLKRSTAKNFRDDLFRFFDYLYTMAPAHSLGVQIMRCAHYIQIALIAYYPYNSILWKDGYLLGQIFRVLSIISFIAPARSDYLVHFIIELILYSAFFVYIIFFLISFRFFLLYTKINTISIKIITFFLNALLPYLISFTSSNIGVDTFLVIEGRHQTSLAIFGLVFGVVLLISMLILQLIFVTPSLTFRPQAIHILSTRVSLIYFFFVIIFSFSTTFGSLDRGYAGLFFMFISVVPCSLLLYYLYLHSEIWATTDFHVALLAIVQMIAVMTVVLPTVAQINVAVNEIEIFIFTSLFFVTYKIGPRFLSNTNRKNLLILDKIEENEELLVHVSKNRYLQLLRSGFDAGHRLCHTWKLFKMADDKMVKNKTYLILFARYAAIYPDESTVLHYVNRLIQNVKHNCIEMKYLSFQINNLLQQRERGLSKSIKKTTSKIADKTEKCRGQLRLIWESVICGATADLDSLTTQLKKNEDEITREYSQLCLVYPNNPYVASDYAAFLSDIMCKDKEAADYAQIYRLLRSGARTRIERSYYFATRHIQTLPTESKHAELNSDGAGKQQQPSETKSCASVALGNAGDIFDLSEDKTQQRYIETMVDAIRLPSLRYGPFLLFFAISIVIPVLSIPIILQINQNMNEYQSSVNLMELFSFIRTYVSHIMVTSYYYVLSQNGIVPTLSKLLLIQDKTDKQIFLGTVNLSRTTLNDFNVIFPNMSKTGYFKEPLHYFYSPEINFDSYFKMDQKTSTNWSFQHIIAFSGLVAVELSNKKNYQMLKFPEFLSLITNSFSFLDQSETIVYHLLKSNKDMMFGYYNSLLKYVASVGSITFVICIFFTSFVFWRLNIEKSLLFDSFKALPKSAISAIVAKLDAQSGRHNTNEQAQPLTVQEENAMRVLSVSLDNSKHNIGTSITILSELLVALVTAIVGIYLLIAAQQTLNDHFPEMCTSLFDLSRVQSTFLMILLSEMRISSSNNQIIENAFKENLTELFDQCSKLLYYQTNNIHSMRFGKNNQHDEGISSIGNEIIDLLTQTPPTTTKIPSDNSDIVSQLSLENGLMFIFDLLYEIYKDLLFRRTVIRINDDRFLLVYKYLAVVSQPIFIVQGINIVDRRISEMKESIKNSYIVIPITILDIVIFACGLLVIPKFIDIGERAQWAMRLLLFCPSNVVFQSHTITKLLSNDFTKSDSDENENSSQFFEIIIAHLSDPVVFIDTTKTIFSINNAFFNMFKKDIAEVKDKSLHEIFETKEGHESSLRNFLTIFDNVEQGISAPSFSCDVEISIDDEPHFFIFTIIAINKDSEVQNKIAPYETISMFSLTMTNRTELVKLSNEYEKERSSIEHLLSIFIPLPVVSKVINRYTNISFTVPSVSIVIIDIIGFGNACSASESAVQIMQRLDKLFLEFEKILLDYGEMMKITSIGDTFMAAGGVFDEVNQPQVHAKQAISFGIDAISHLDLMNVQNDMPFRIRVGMNTGGPMVAGVLLIEKPTFELLGPPMAIARLMEKTGKAMQVHIPQIVYELVYGDQFIIKEAGLIEFKNQTVQTYTVTGYDQQI